MAAQKRTNNSSASNYELMETIRKYPVIYDKSCDDQIEKKDAWAAVAVELNIDVAEAQNRYGNVRTVFSRYLKGIRRRRPGDGGGGIGRLGCDIKLKDCFEYLRWIIGYIKPRNSGSEGKRKNNSGDGDDGDDDDDTSPDEEYNEEGEGGDMWTDLLKEAISASASCKSEGKFDRRQGPDSAPSTSSVVPKSSSSSSNTASKHALRTHSRSHKKKKAAMASPTTTGSGRRPQWSTVEKLLTGARRAGTAASVQQASHDEDMMFCLSLAPKMRRLPERFKTAAQLRILQVICDYEMTDPLPASQGPD